MIEQGETVSQLECISYYFLSFYPHRTRDGYTEPIPKRDSKTNVLLFPDAKDFRPNMTPKEVLQKGSFGGTYYRPIKSSVTGLRYNKVWLELPQNWLEGLEVRKKISSSVYDEGVNTYKVKKTQELQNENDIVIDEFIF